MVCGIGIDLIEISRISRSMERFGIRFIERILRPEEIAELKGSDAAYAQSLAARFAVKEAAVKALGTGFSQGISMQHIAISKNELGQPQLHFYAQALLAFSKLGAKRSHVSISHARDMATAVVVLESD